MDKVLDKSEKISINLNCYTIRFRKKGDKSTFYNYNEVFPQTAFEQLIQGFIKTIDTSCYKNNALDRIMSLQEILTFNSSNVSGVLRKGHSSHESYIEELNNNKPVTVNTIRADQYNSSPFYFSLTLPNPVGKVIIFIAQSYKQYGFKEVFEEAFVAFFKSMYGDEFICEFGSLSIASLFKKYVNDGSIRKLRLRKYGLIPQVEGIVQDQNYDIKDYEIEMSIKAKRKKTDFLSHFRNMDFGQTSFVELFKVDNFIYDEALVEITSGGRKRVLNFSDPSSFAASYDVTKQAAINKSTKHPDFNALDKEAIQILHQEVIPHIE
jgi:hypothetical protein